MWKKEERALELSTRMEEDCKPLEKCSLGEKECEGFESLQDSSFEEEPTETRSLEAICGKLNSSKSEFGDKILFLAKELKEEESEQDELVVDISKRIQSLEDESKLLKSQVAEAKTTFRIFQMNEELLKISIKDTLSESSQLQESQKQLLQEAEEWEEQVSELNEQKITFEDSKVYAKQVLCDKENQIKSLTEYLLKMRDWTAVLGEEVRDDNLELEMSDSENSVLSGDQPKGDLKKLIHTAKLKAYLKTLEGERNQIYTQLTEVDKTKGELIECIKNLQAEHTSLQSENEHLENENQKLQHKLKVMTEMYQENEKILNRKLTVEENYRLEKEKKRSKGDEKITHATEDLETYRKRAKDLEEELERTIHSYQGQIISHEKKAHDNWLAAWTAERNLSNLKKENFYLRQKLTETELKFELLEKDLYALDAPNTAFCREHSPYGLSPLGQPSSETRTFLSLPTLLEGPLRLSPLLPGGRRRDLRGPGNPQDHQITNERGESSSDKLTHPHREPSDTGSLSPPWEQDHRMIIPPSGQPYPDPALPLHRQDRFYANICRPSGPAEHRSFNMPDGSMSSKMESSGNDSKDHLGNLNMPDASLPTKSKVTGPGVDPPIRGSLFPMDARGPYMRRGPPFPLLPGSKYGASCDYFPPGDFSGPPPPPLAMRNVYSPRAFPPYLLPRAGFYHHILKEETETETSGERSPSSPHSSVPDTPSESQVTGFSPVLEKGPDYHCWEILHCSFACQ